VFPSLYYTHGTVTRTTTKGYINTERVSREDWAIFLYTVYVEKELCKKKKRKPKAIDIKRGMRAIFKPHSKSLKQVSSKCPVDRSLRLYMIPSTHFVT
jgi:hypothetical protein